MQGCVFLEKNLRAKKSKKQTFVWGAAVLAISHIFVKIVGAGFKIPLDRFILKPEGMGIYTASYSIYNWLFVISTAGIPVAISKMVSEAYAVGNIKQAKRVFGMAKILMLIVGIIGAAMMFFGAGIFANLLSVKSAKYSMMALAPSLFFVAMMSAYRGYSQGMGNMIPTALSEVAEALGKLAAGLFLAAAFIGYGVQYGAAGAIAGVSVGGACGLLLLMIANAFSKKHLQYNVQSKDLNVSARRDILKKLIKIAVPITLGVSVFTLTSLIDTAMIMNILSSMGYTESQYTSLFGYLNRAVTMFNVPPTIIAAISVSCVPVISGALAQKKPEAAIETAKSALRITIMFSFPCAVGMSTLASPILQLIYSDSAHYFLLTITALSVAFVTLVQTGNAILQSYGHVWKPVVNMALGGVVKVAVNFILVSRPGININGAPIGTLLCYFTVMLLNLISIKRITHVTYEMSDFFIKPLLSVAVMGCVCVIVYDFIFRAAGNYIIAMMGAVLAAVAVYGVMVLAVGCVKKEDIYLLPKGEKIYSLLKKLHFMK